MSTDEPMKGDVIFPVHILPRTCNRLTHAIRMNPLQNISSSTTLPNPIALQQVSLVSKPCPTDVAAKHTTFATHCMCLDFEQLFIIVNKYLSSARVLNECILFTEYLL